MMTAHAPNNSEKTKATRRRAIAVGAIAVVIGLMALDTTVIQVGSENDVRQQAFNPDAFGLAEYPRIRDDILQRAPDALTLAAALGEDKAAAVANFGTKAGAFPVLPVKFTGTLGEGVSGIFGVTVDDMPAGMTLRVQTGPAINGTELRDIVGDIEFGAFTNQIEYQDAGAGINRAMAADILSGLDRDALTGKTVTVTGAFTLINPKSWLITPVTLEVQE